MQGHAAQRRQSNQVACWTAERTAHKPMCVLAEHRCGVEVQWIRRVPPEHDIPGSTPGQDSKITLFLLFGDQTPLAFLLFFGFQEQKSLTSCFAQMDLMDLMDLMGMVDLTVFFRFKARPWRQRERACERKAEKPF